MLENKRRRREEPREMEMEVEEPIPAATVPTSNVPSGFLAWQAAKKRNN
jgi:hypothetical protein